MPPLKKIAAGNAFCQYRLLSSSFGRGRVRVRSLAGGFFKRFARPLNKPQIYADEHG